MKGANKCMLLAVIAYPLKKLLKWNQGKTKNARCSYTGKLAKAIMALRQPHTALFS